MRTPLVFSAHFIAVSLFLVVAGTSVSAQTEAPSPASYKPAAAATASPAAAVAEPATTFTAINVDGPYIAMTFDDGPHATLTPKLLDLLEKRKIKATFFVVGQCAAEYPDILKRMAREGHEIANHSWSHPNLGKMGDDAVRQQLEKTDNAIKAATGKRTTLMRPPYGSVTARQKRWFHDQLGYSIILWDVDPLDWRRPGVSVVTNRIVTGARPGSIILAHDIHPSTVEAMPATLDQLEAKGFKFVTVSQLLALQRPPSAPTRSTSPASPAPETNAERAPAPAPASPASATNGR